MAEHPESGEGAGVLPLPPSTLQLGLGGVAPGPAPLDEPPEMFQAGLTGLSSDIPTPEVAVAISGAVWPVSWLSAGL